MAKKRIMTALLACTLLSGCQGSGGSGSPSASSTTASPTAAPQTSGTGTGPSSPAAFGQSTTAPTTLVLVPSGTHSLGIYLRNPWTGALVDRGYVPTGQGPSAVAASLGQYVYVANTKDGTISAYGWQAATNELTALKPAVVTSGTGVFALAVAGNFLYALNTNNTISVFNIANAGTPSVLPAIPTPSKNPTLTSLVTGSSGQLYGLGNLGITAYSVGSDGTLTDNGTTALSGIIAGARDNAGNLYALTATAVTAFSANGSGGLTVQSSVSLPTGLTPVGLTTTGDSVAVAGNTSGGTEVVYFPVTNGQIGPSTTSPITGTGTASGISASPGGHYVFVSNPGRNDIFAYTTPTATSAAVMSSALRTRTLPQSPVSLSVTVALSPATLYVVNQSTTTIGAYPSLADGTLGTPTISTTCISCTTNIADQGPSAAVIAPNGLNLYVSDWAEAGLGDLTTFGMSSPNGPLGTPSSIAAGQSPMGVAIDASSRYLYVANSCYQNGGGNCAGTIDGYNLTQGTPSAFTNGFSTGVFGNYPMLLAADPTGRFLYSSEFAGDMVDSFAINPDTGALNLTGYVTTNRGPWTIVIGPTGRHVYVSDNGSTTVSIFTINSATGALTPFAQSALAAPPPANSPIPGVSKPLGLAIGPHGRRLYVATQDGTLDVFTRQDPLSASGPWGWTPAAIAGNFTNAYGLALSANGKALYVVDNCTAPDYNNGSIQALAVPAFSAMSTSSGVTTSGYVGIGQYQTNACSVQAIPAGGLN
ncbi:MAG: beta-propeller fold lactonase family protein [Acidiferrobacter sp.]